MRARVHRLWFRSPRHRLAPAAALAASLASGGLHAAVCDGVSPANNTQLKSVVVAQGLPGRPLYVTAPPGDTQRLFIVAQDGLILIKKRGTPAGAFQTFLDIRDRVATNENEMGLLGLAFDPDYDTTGFFYVYYTDATGGLPCGLFGTQCSSVVSRFSVSSADPDAGDPASEVELMRFPQPQGNHNGGQIVFGPDGMLYIFTGDGGGAGDDDAGHGACGNGQNLETLLGKILRIDVRGVDPAGTSPDTACMTGFVAAGYTVPSDNPFQDGSDGRCDEIWAHGLRNPWRNDFDEATGDLYVADVGQNCWEEVDYVSADGIGGENYGWRQMEGNHCFNHLNPSNCNATSAPDCTPPCHDPSFTDPVVEYSHSAGCSITGGHVYRGCRMPNFDGTYFYGDFCSGFIRSFEIDNGVPVNPQDWTSQIDPTGALANDLTSFGEDAQGELYIVDRDGELRKILPPFPDLEVSGRGAGEMFRLHRDGNWTWEDLEFSTMHPVDFYRIYRGVPNGVFVCIHSTPEPFWTQGDTTVPDPGQLLAYVVTAVFGGEETQSGDPPRNLANPCPAP